MMRQTRIRLDITPNPDQGLGLLSYRNAGHFRATGVQMVPKWSQMEPKGAQMMPLETTWCPNGAQKCT